MEVQQAKRAPGTGCIHRTPYGKYRAMLRTKKKNFTKTFHTVEECEAWLESISI